MNRRRVMGGGIPAQPSWQSYVQNGLVACWDGEANTGTSHDADATNWIDCVAGYVTAGHNATWGDNYAAFGGSTRFIVSAADAIAAFKNLYVEAVFMTNSPTAFQMVFCSESKRVIGLNKTVLVLAGSSSGNKPGYSPITTTDIVSLSVNYSNWSLYKNGVQQTKTMDVLNGTGNNYLIGARLQGSSWSGYLNGKIYCLRFYDRKLSESEIVTNFNVDKARFGIQ